MKSGTWWVLGVLGLGAVAGLIAVTYWQRPENSVRWSFTQIHTSLVKGKKDAAARFLAPRVSWNGKEMTSAEFLAAYTLPSEADEIETAVCPTTPSHLVVTMKGLVYCFVSDGKTFWRLHALTNGRCACNP
jgi:hypothetical protein